MSKSRRNFIKTTSIGIPALVMLHSPQFLKGENKKLGVALVGLGNYATRQLAPALKHCTHCELRGIVTGSPDKAIQWKKEYNIKESNVYNYQNFDQIKNNPEIDIVYVVLPNSMHAEYTIRAAQAGKHVICEKPMAMNVAECQAMIDACKKTRVKLSIGYRLYFEPHHLEIRRLAQEKVYGTVKMIESSLGFSMADPKIWRLNKALGGGGAIMDLGVYCIQGARRTINELPIAVTAQGFNTNKTVFKDIYEGMFFQMDFPSGVISNSSTSYSSYVDKLHVSAGWQSYMLEPSYNASGAAGKIFDGTYKPMDIKRPDYQQTAQMDAFAKNIIDNTNPIASGEEGLIDLKIIEAIVRAADTGKKIELKW